MAIVYIHKRIDNGEVFYVGIGKTEKRAKSKDKRSKFWKARFGHSQRKSLIGQHVKKK